MELEWLRSLDPERLDVPALVRLAVRADVMGSLGLPAGRADLNARSLERVLSPALVAPRSRGSSLGDGHERLRSIATAPGNPGVSKG
jgi:hypothetical protein